MTSSASSPFKLCDVQVRENERVVWVSGLTHHARFVLTHVDKQASVRSWHDVLLVAGTVEITNKPWLGPTRIESSSRIGSIGARVEFNIATVITEHTSTYEDALWFACKELNPMLESFTTLFGIKHNIDIVVDHGLRPVKQLLVNLVQPAPKSGHLKFNTKGRYNL
jgi:hypothetical protein